MKIRTHLGGLIIATLLPAALFGVAGAYILLERERETFERGARDRVRVLMSAIDAYLGASIAPLEVLARTPSLDGDDLGAFRAEAARALEATRGSWASVMVSHPDTAQMLLNLGVPAGEPLPKLQDPATILDAARALRPTIGHVAVSPVLGRPAFAVSVPVVREGKAKYVLSADVEIAAIARLVERQGFPETWAVAVIDGNYRFVMRHPPAGGSEFASDSLKKALATAEEGWSRGRLLDRSEIYRAFRRSSISPWSVSIAIPRSVVERGMQDLWLLFAGVIVASAVGLWIAWRLALRLTRPIAALARAAPALGRGEVSALPPPSPLDEVRELSHALGDAAVAVRDREERQVRAEQALRAADRAKDEFLAMLGHELRNPLASISNAAQLMRIARDQPGVMENTSAILSRQVEHITRLVDDLLEVGRITGGKVHLEREPLDLALVAAVLVDTWKASGRFGHHDLKTEFGEVWVQADRARMEQVLSNLLDNALRYTPAGGCIEVAVRACDANAVLEVRDTGEGMSPELAGRVFDLFVQGERGLARAAGGLGIGLTMAKRLVELHGGTIEAASEGPGKGASFIVKLDAIQAAELPLPRREAQPASTSKKILIVEDNRDARETLTTLLQLHGHDVQSAENGAAALKTAATMLPEIALIDIGLPDMDGYLLAGTLRRLPGLPEGMRLIALTGYGASEDRQRALAAGFDEHLKKPVDIDVLERILSVPAKGSHGGSLSG